MEWNGHKDRIEYRNVGIEYFLKYFNNPNFQNSNIIEMLILGLKPPKQIVIHEKTVIIGENFVYSLVNFLKDGFPLKNLTWLSEYGNMTFSQLPRNIQRKIEYVVVGIMELYIQEENLDVFVANLKDFYNEKD